MFFVHIFPGLIHEGLLDRSIAVRRTKTNLKISGREAPKLTQIVTEKIENGIRLKAPGMETFVIPDSFKGGELVSWYAI